MIGIILEAAYCFGGRWSTYYGFSFDLISLTVVQIVGSFILAQGSITANLVVYEELFNPILSDSFGFTIKQTSYFFVLLLPAFVGGSFLV